MEILFLAIALTFVWHLVILYSPVILGAFLSNSLRGEIIAYIIGTLATGFYIRLSSKFGTEPTLWGLGLSLVAILVWQLYLRYELAVLGQFRNYSTFIKTSYISFVVLLAVRLFS